MSVVGVNFIHKLNLLKSFFLWQFLFYDQEFRPSVQIAASNQRKYKRHSRPVFFTRRKEIIGDRTRVFRLSEHCLHLLGTSLSHGQNRYLLWIDPSTEFVTFSSKLIRDFHSWKLLKRNILGLKRNMITLYSLGELKEWKEKKKAMNGFPSNWNTDTTKARNCNLCYTCYDV